MPDSQIYKVFMDTPEEPLLFSFKQSPNLRPKVGDSITRPLTFQNFRIMRDEFVSIGETRVIGSEITRLTDSGDTRLTDSGDTRILDTVLQTRVTDDGLIRLTDGDGPDSVTHNYFVLPANDPQRISTWTTNKFADDQVLRQLFR